MERPLLDVWQDVVEPSARLELRGAEVGVARTTGGPAPAREPAGVVLVGEAAERELLKVVAALHLPGCLPRRLHGRQQQRDQNADDRDDDQEFDEGKTRASLSGRLRHGLRSSILLCIDHLPIVAAAEMATRIPIDRVARQADRPIAKGHVEPAWMALPKKYMLGDSLSHCGSG